MDTGKSKKTFLPVSWHAKRASPRLRLETLFDIIWNRLVKAEFARLLNQHWSCDADTRRL